jgi:UrcA family protein
MNSTLKNVAAIAARMALASVISAAILGTAVRSATAQTPDGDVQTSVVSIDGLNLATPAGQSVLHHRLRVAATKVCQNTVGGGSILSDAFTNCFREAMGSAHAHAQHLIAEAQSRAVVAFNTH